MNPGRFVAYYRVSTDTQARSGLGLEAQHEAVRRFLVEESGELIAEFTDIESGRVADRPQLVEALRLCRVYRATLVIAKLDRLARNVALITKLMDSGADFVAADMPLANRFTIHILAAVAEYELKLMSERSKAASAIRKARGPRWAASFVPIFRPILSAGPQPVTRLAASAPWPGRRTYRR
jgi:DNA invertase Pin-like site-specific DNA recombinase